MSESTLKNTTANRDPDGEPTETYTVSWFEQQWAPGPKRWYHRWFGWLGIRPEPRRIWFQRWMAVEVPKRLAEDLPAMIESLLNGAHSGAVEFSHIEPPGEGPHRLAQIESWGDRDSIFMPVTYSDPDA